MTTSTSEDRVCKALADRRRFREEYALLCDGPVSYFMSILTYGDLLKEVAPDVNFGTPAMWSEYYRRLGWDPDSVTFLGDTVVEAKMGECKVTVSNRCRNEGVFVIRRGGPATIPQLSTLAGQILDIQVLTVKEFAALIPKTETPSPDKRKPFIVCTCEPPPEMCMCDWCHDCGGVKREYAEKYRASQWHVEKST